MDEHDREDLLSRRERELREAARNELAPFRHWRKPAKRPRRRGWFGIIVAALRLPFDWLWGLVFGGRD